MTTQFILVASTCLDAILLMALWFCYQYNLELQKRIDDRNEDLDWWIANSKENLQLAKDQLDHCKGLELQVDPNKKALESAAVEFANGMIRNYKDNYGAIDFDAKHLGKRAAEAAKSIFDNLAEPSTELTALTEENARLRDKCERLDCEVKGLMKAALMNGGGECNATGTIMTDAQHTEAYQKHILSMFGNG